ncbi:hypothetical protein [Domibacillus tundrae]|uniref:hypothetical protein n=1 Tax=Domibacillus tundrae TaxID=1587527 RepID=UPI0012E00090|nr:hypothetical protein [Domibacillus tundrae]
MEKKATGITKKLVEASCHIVYCFHELETYVMYAAAYITAGMEKGKHVLLVENHKITRLIDQKLRAVLTEEQRKLVHLETNVRIRTFSYPIQNGYLFLDLMIN